jgi:hypothetical protein
MHAHPLPVPRPVGSAGVPPRPARLVPAAGSSRLTAARAALVLDVRAAVAALPADLRAFARRLMDGDGGKAVGPRAAHLQARLADALRPLDPRVRRV